MLTLQEFFSVCAGFWTTERTYHFVQTGEIERSYTEFQVNALTEEEKQRILNSVSQSSDSLQVDFSRSAEAEEPFSGFAIAFNTVSDKDERVAMNLNALFVPDRSVASIKSTPNLPLPLAAEVTDGEVIQGFYLRDEGYSESGSIAGRFTYQPTRQTLEMTTHYKRSVAVDQMRLLSPNLRLRTIVTYQRDEGKVPSVITLVGFGVEKKK
ncbi:phycobiliprotein lyase [Phormidesmis priestleyi ULC007]|uniref:Chromophore lyase CpcS/CpeS n=1 Tax=Phormidesmis priestleyi ULC007 TaxID=1920490 RepID=A0A2T1DGY8_9CYAN|nr:phycobiliprotein lyase [Phormidesmis priestleyi]PSB19704.1 phycobiliprotein lyase [Phormidesmis priestleyi ULC007]PZO53588.1 MAG: phycobiliprotein lyase [Phormidesmis priestleyi]